MNLGWISQPFFKFIINLSTLALVTCLLLRLRFSPRCLLNSLWSCKNLRTHPTSSSLFLNWFNSQSSRPNQIFLNNSFQAHNIKRNPNSLAFSKPFFNSSFIYNILGLPYFGYFDASDLYRSSWSWRIDLGISYLKNENHLSASIWLERLKKSTYLNWDTYFSASRKYSSKLMIFWTASGILFDCSTHKADYEAFFGNFWPSDKNLKYSIKKSATFTY